MSGDAALEALIRALNTSPADGRRVICEALGQRRDPRALDALAETLADPDGYIRTAAAMALGQLGDARAVAPLAVALYSSMGDSDDSELLRAAGLAIQRLGGRDAIGPLVAWAGAEPRETPSLRHDPDKVIAIVEKIDPNWARSREAQQAIPALLAHLWHLDYRTRNYRMRSNTKRLLERFEPHWTRSPEARKAIPFLVARLIKRHTGISYEQAEGAGEYLSSIDRNWATSPEARDGIPELIVARAQGGLQKGAKRILESIDSDWAKSEEARRAIPRLVALADKQPKTACEMLAAIGAVESLVDIVNNGGPAREAAHRCLEAGWSERTDVKEALGRSEQQEQAQEQARSEALREAVAEVRRAKLPDAMLRCTHHWTLPLPGKRCMVCRSSEDVDKACTKCLVVVCDDHFSALQAILRGEC
jgi:hypothetical protein